MRSHAQAALQRRHQSKGSLIRGFSAGQSKWRARLQANYFLVACESDLREDFIDEDCFQSVRYFWEVCRVRAGTKKAYAFVSRGSRVLA